MKNNCLNESRPGVTSALLSPPDALRYLEAVCEKIEAKTPVTVVGIAGPGDPFACPDETLTTLRLVRERFPDEILCAATNGLNLAPYAKALAELQVSHVTVTVNTVKPETGAKIYAWARGARADERTVPAPAPVRRRPTLEGSCRAIL